MFAASFNGNSISSAYDAVVEYKTRANDFFFFFSIESSIARWQVAAPLAILFKALVSE